MAERRFFSNIPDGRVIDDEQFETRHRLIVWVLFAHAPVLAVIGLISDFSILHTVLEISPAMVLGGIALMPLNRLPRSIASCLGLVYAASTLIHFAGGITEAHFHWFAVLAFAALYVDARPFVAVVIYTAGHHTAMSIYDSTLLFEHERGQENPFLWTGVHVVFVLLLIGALAINWYTLQQQHDRWVQSSAEQADLLERQSELVEQSGKLADEREANLRHQEELSEDLATRSADLAESSDAVRESIGSTSSAMAEVTESASVVSSLAEEVFTLALKADEETRRARETVEALEEQSRGINKVVGLISDIAGKTNLLALNAAIEAQSAGEAGQGFGVVATEVKSLAKRTSEATKQIRGMTDDVLDRVTDSSQRVAGVAELVRSISERQSEVQAQVSLQRETVDRVSSDVEAASSTMLRVIQGIDDLSESTQAEAASEQIAA